MTPLKRHIAKPATILTGLTLAAGGMLLAVALASAASRLPTKGPIPESAFSSATFDMSAAPDFVPALGRDGNFVGYVSKWDLTEPPTTVWKGQPESIRVYAEDLVTVIGSMIPGKGFVALGVDPSAVPGYPSVARPSP